MTATQFDEIFGHEGPESLIAVDHHLVDLFLSTLGVTGSALEAPAREQILMELRRISDGPFELRVGGWQIDIRKSVAQALLASALMIGAINLTNEGSIPTEVLALALPFLVEVERIELSIADRYVLGRMRVRNLQPATVKEWWKTLPKRLREEMTYLEFLDLIGRLHDAGAVDLESDGTVSLTADRPRLRLGW